MITRKPYSTDISDSQWAILKPLIPSQKPGGRPRTVNMREILNSIFYILATGCPWRLMPHDLPPWLQLTCHTSSNFRHEPNHSKK